MIEFLGSNFEAMKEPPEGVHDLMESWLSQMSPLQELGLGYRLIEKAKGRSRMARIHLQGIRNERFVNARVKPDKGGNENCWIVSIPVPRGLEADDFFEDLQISANRINGWTEAQLEERQMRALHALLKGEPVDLSRIKETAAIEAGFPTLDWLSSALANLSTKGQFVRSVGSKYEWINEFDALARKDWRPPTEPPPHPTDPVTAFIQALSVDGLAAAELLGELPSIEEEDGKPRIRIPNDFPLPEEERESFYLRAEGIGLLKAVGASVYGIQERVWELDFAIYEETLEIIGELGLVSHQSAETLENDRLIPAIEPEEAPSSVETHQQQIPAAATVAEPTPLVTSTPDPEPNVSDIREQLGAARARRASAIAEHNELQKQYQETVRDISEIAGPVSELNRQLKELNIKLNHLHQMRAKLKKRVKSTGREHTDACKEAKQLSIQLEKLTQASTEKTAISFADLLREESMRSGIPIDRLMGKVREKLRAP